MQLKSLIYHHDKWFCGRLDDFYVPDVSVKRFLNYLVSEGWEGIIYLYLSNVCERFGKRCFIGYGRVLG